MRDTFHDSADQAQIRNSSIEKEEVESKHKWRIRALILIGTALYFFVNVQRVAIPGSVFNELQLELDVGAPSITGLGASFMIVYAFTQLVIGMLVDRYGGIRIITFGAAIFCAGSLMFPLSHSLPMLYTSRVLSGLGAGTIFLSLIKETMRAFKDNYAIFVSVVGMIGFTGGIMANAPFVAISENCVGGFRSTLLFCGVTTLLFYLIFVALQATVPSTPVRGDIPISLSAFGTVLKSRHNVILYAFSGVNFGMFYALQTVIGKKFLQDYCFIGSQNAATILSTMGAISAVSGFIFVMLSRSIGNRRRPFCRLAGLVNLVVFTLLTAAIVLDIRSKAIAGLLCLLGTVGSMSAIIIPIIKETNPESRTGLAVSLMNFCFYLSVAVLGGAVGHLMNVFPPAVVDGVKLYGRSSYLAVFSVMSLCSLVVFGCSMQVKETGGRAARFEG